MQTMPPFAAVQGASPFSMPHTLPFVSHTPEMQARPPIVGVQDQNTQQQSADEGSHHAQNQVSDHAVAAATHQLPGKPSSRNTDD